MSKERPPRVPQARQQTERQRLIELMIDAPPQDAKELSGCAGISMKEVYAHLKHIDKSLGREGKQLVIEPATCRSCGFVFTKHGAFKKPGKCPGCRDGRVEPPLYYVK